LISNQSFTLQEEEVQLWTSKTILFDIDAGTFFGAKQASDSDSERLKTPKYTLLLIFPRLFGLAKILSKIFETFVAVVGIVHCRIGAG
jgi:hypothetical protein